MNRKALCAALLTLGLAMRVPSQEVPLDDAAFTEYVASLLRAQVGASTVVIKEPLTLKLGNMQANLDRVLAFCKRNSGGCATAVATFIRGATETYRAQNTPISRDAILFVIRPSQYVQQVQASIGPSAPKLLPTPFLGDLILLPVLDSPTTLRWINEKDLITLALSEQELQHLAVKNLRSTVKLKPLMDVAKVAIPGRIGQLVGDSFYPSRIALLDTWAPLADVQGGKLIVVAPASDTVLYIGDDSPVAIEALRSLAHTVFAQAPHPLSETLLRWTAAKWEVVH